MKKIIFTLAILSIFTFISCKTVKEIPNDYSAAKIIQMGQNAYDLADYKSAEKCYEAAITRYGTNLEIYVEAKYELAHTYLAEKKYNQAYEIYNEILGIYEQVSYGDLPSSYKKLALIGLSQIPENQLEKSNPAEAE